MVSIFSFATDNPFDPLKDISGSIPHRLCDGANGFDSALEVISHHLCPKANGLGSAPKVFDAAGSLKSNDRNNQRDAGNDQRDNFHSVLPLFITVKKACFLSNFVASSLWGKHY
jgi:hypothetical protein